LIRFVAVVGLLFIAACGNNDHFVDVNEPHAEAVIFEIQAGERELTIQLASATVDPSGDGRGQEATAEISGPPPLKIEGKRSKWRMRDGVVVFEGDVVARRGEVVMRCQHLEVTYDGNNVKRVVATGGVTISKGEQTARGGNAVLTVVSGRLELKDNPTLEEGPNRMQGDAIIFFLDEEEVECIACKLHVTGLAVVPEKRSR